MFWQASDNTLSSQSACDRRDFMTGVGRGMATAALLPVINTNSPLDFKAIHQEPELSADMTLEMCRNVFNEFLNDPVLRSDQSNTEIHFIITDDFGEYRRLFNEAAGRHSSSSGAVKRNKRRLKIKKPAFWDFRIHSFRQDPKQDVKHDYYGIYMVDFKKSADLLKSYAKGMFQRHYKRNVGGYGEEEILDNVINFFKRLHPRIADHYGRDSNIVQYIRRVIIPEVSQELRDLRIGRETLEHLKYRPKNVPEPKPKQNDSSPVDGLEEGGDDTVEDPIVVDLSTDVLNDNLNRLSFSRGSRRAGYKSLS